jgi:hypothetical protein
MQSQQPDQNPDSADQGRLPDRDRSNVNDVPDNAERNLREKPPIGDPNTGERPRRAPGDDELEDEGYEGEEDVNDTTTP